MILVPITLREARDYVEQFHRHHKAPQGGVFAIGAAEPEKGLGICGVIIVGRPVARGAQDGWTAEVTRCATDGTRNACSKLYAAAWRACRAMGYTKLITYTLPHEGGASLRGAGFRVVAQTRGGSWNCKTRPRVDSHPLQGKPRWERTADGA